MEYSLQMYVQELAETVGSDIHDLLVNRGAHFYVCGDCKMAEDVHQKLKGILKKHGDLTDEQVHNFMFMLKVSWIIQLVGSDIFYNIIIYAQITNTCATPSLRFDHLNHHGHSTLLCNITTNFTHLQI